MADPVTLPGDVAPGAETPPPQESPSPSPTPLQAFSGQLIPAYRSAGLREVETLRASAEHGEEGRRALRDLSDSQDFERQMARPRPQALPSPPPTEQRPFLAPGKGFLDQIQTAILGITQMGLGIAGAGKGGGYAIGAVAGLKGALEGWQAGDHERVDREIKSWKMNVEKLQSEYADKIAAYRDLLTDQKRAFAERLADIGIRARIDGDAQMAAAVDKNNIGDIVSLLATSEQQARQFALQMGRLDQTAQLHADTNQRMRDIATENRLSREQMAREANTAKVEAAKERAADRETFANTLRDRKPMSGVWLDKDAQGIQRADGLTEGEFRDNGGRNRYGQVLPAQLQAAQVISSQGLPAIARMRELLPSVLAKYGGQNLMKAMEDAAAGRLGDPEVREFQQIATTIASEYSRATGGSPALRKFVFDVIRETEVPNTKDRIAGAEHLLANTENVMWNFIRELKGKPAYTYPGSGRELEVVRRSTGQRGTLKLEPWKAVPPEFEVVY